MDTNERSCRRCVPQRVCRGRIPVNTGADLHCPLKAKQFPSASAPRAVGDIIVTGGTAVRAEVLQKDSK